LENPGKISDLGTRPADKSHSDIGQKESSGVHEVLVVGGDLFLSDGVEEKFELFQWREVYFVIFGIELMLITFKLSFRLVFVDFLLEFSEIGGKICLLLLHERR